jgi:hypothetical protein
LRFQPLFLIRRYIIYSIVYCESSEAHRFCLSRSLQSPRTSPHLCSTAVLSFKAMAQPSSSTPEKIWHSAFPTPSFNTPRMSHEVLAELIGQRAFGVDYIVVDVRRTDFEVGFSYRQRSTGVFTFQSTSLCLSKGQSIYQRIRSTPPSQPL